MPYRLTKIYTRKGDDGFTNLGDHRIPKDDLLVEAVGTLDELNSHIGLITAFQITNKEIQTALMRIQNELFDMGGELHYPEKVTISSEKITYLEKLLDDWNSSLPPLKEFLLPRGNPASVQTHIARTVCRRAERRLVSLHLRVPLHNPELLRYLNRLSDLLFVIGRLIALEDKQKETLWDHERGKT